MRIGVCRVVEVDKVKRNRASMELRVMFTPELVEGAGGDAGPSGCCSGVVAGAALGQCLAWEGGTPLSCSSSCDLGVEEVRGSKASVELEVRSIPELVGGVGVGACCHECCLGAVAGIALGCRLVWGGGTPLSCLLFLQVEEGEWA